MAEERVIIFDDSCPMCRLYTLGFVAVGAIKRENRVGFASVEDSILEAIDQDRARHEIPLYDRESGQTLYGLEALLYLIGARFPWMQFLLKRVWFRRGLKPLYWLITYNRRVMAGCRPAAGFDCAPDFHAGWRLAYLSGTASVCLTVLIWGWTASPHFFPWMVLLGVWFVGMVLPVCMPWVTREVRWNRLGNVATSGLLYCLVAAIGLLMRDGSWEQFGVWVVAVMLLVEETWRRWERE